MTNDRIYLYDNIKGLLIILVVFAHLLEPANTLTGIAKYIYLLIYSFHMPAFVYVTGVFSSFKPKKDFVRLILPYIVFQFLYVIFAVYVLKDKVKPPLTTPYWLMWFLPCTFLWRFVDSILKKTGTKVYCVLIPVFFALALLAGKCGKIGHTFSLSRLICFMPFFMLGSALGVKKRINKSYAVFCLVGYIICFALYVLFKLNDITPDVFYYTYSYKAMNYSALIRLWIMLAAVLATLCLVAFMPDKRTYLCRLGQNSVCIYLLHGFIVKLLNKIQINLSVSLKIVLALLLALIITYVLSLPIVKKVYDYLFSLEFLIKNDGNLKV